LLGIKGFYIQDATGFGGQLSWTTISLSELSTETCKMQAKGKVSSLTIGLFISISCIHSFTSLIY